MDLIVSVPEFTYLLLISTVSSFVYGFMSLDYGFGTMTATTFLFSEMLH